MMDKLKQWEEMGSRAVAGGRSKDAQGLLPVEAVIPNQIWPNEWDQEVAMVAYLIHCHEQRIATLEKALEPFAREAAEWGNQARDDDFVRVCGQLDEDPVDSEVTVGDLRRAAALLEKK